MRKKIFISILVLIIASSSLTTTLAALPTDGEFYEPSDEYSSFIYNPIYENSSGYLSGPLSTILNYQGKTYNCLDFNHSEGMKIGAFEKNFIYYPIPPYVWAYWKYVGLI